MSTQAQTITAALTGLDFSLTCQVVNWFILLDKQAGPECGKPAEYVGAVHSFRDCTSRDKFLCAACVPSFAKPCAVCGAARLTDLRPVRNTL